MAILCENTPHLDPEQWKKLEESTVPLSEQRKKELKELKQRMVHNTNGTVIIQS